MKIKGAIFDFDGTLVDSMKTWHSLGYRYLKKVIDLMRIFGIIPKQ